MKTIKFYSIGLVATIIFTFSQQSFAQWDFYSSPGYSNLINNLISNSIWNSSMENYTKKNNKGSSGASKSKSSNQTSPPEVPAYRRYPAVQFKSTGTRLMLQEYLDAFDGNPHINKTELKELILEIFKKYEAAAAAKGYPNDWALAYVSYIGLNSHVYHEIKEKPIIPFEQNIGLRDVVAEYATDNGIFNNYPDRKKQELYELLVMMGGLTYHLYEKAVREKNSEELKAIKLIAAQNLKLLGIKP